jgi:hypothetical protein
MSGHHRWRGYSHDELYRKIHAGPGAAASTAAISRWADMSSVLSEVTGDLHGAIETAGATWQGVSAENAWAGLGPLGTWADDARVGADVMKLSAELQAEYVSKARSDMPKPLPVTAERPSSIESGLAHLVGVQTDFERQEATQSAAEQRAYDVMSTYESSTKDNTSTLGRFTRPPTVVVDSPAPAFGSGARGSALTERDPHGSPGRVTTRGSKPIGRKPTGGTTGEPRSTTRPAEPARVSSEQVSSEQPARSGSGPVGGSTRTPTPSPTAEPATSTRPAGSTSAHARIPEQGSASNAAASAATPSQANGRPPPTPTIGRSASSRVSHPALSSAASSPPASARRTTDTGIGTSSGENPPSQHGPPPSAAATHSMATGRREEGDHEHRVADYFVTEDIFGVDQVVAPAVIGEDPAQR